MHRRIVLASGLPWPRALSPHKTVVFRLPACKVKGLLFKFAFSNDNFVILLLRDFVTVVCMDHFPIREASDGYSSR